MLRHEYECKAKAHVHGPGTSRWQVDLQGPMTMNQLSWVQFATHYTPASTYKPLSDVRASVLSGFVLFVFLFLFVFVCLRKISAYRNHFRLRNPWTERRKDKQTEPARGHVPRSRAFPRRLCVRAPFTNVELEIWIQCYGKFSCEIRYLLQSLLDNLASSHFSGFVNLLSSAGLSSSYLKCAFDAMQPLSDAIMCGVWESFNI
jgi:hypothetical protein